MKNNADIYISLQNKPYEKLRGTLTTEQGSATASFCMQKNHVDVSVCDGAIRICNRGELSYLFNFANQEFSSPIITPFGTTTVHVKVIKSESSVNKDSLSVHCEYLLEDELHVFKLKGRIL